MNSGACEGNSGIAARTRIIMKDLQKEFEFDLLGICGIIEVGS